MDVINTFISVLVKKHKQRGNMQGNYSEFNNTVHPDDIQNLNKGMKYILTGAASVLFVLGLTFGGTMVYSMYTSWQANNISNPQSTKKSLAATKSSVGQFSVPVTTLDKAALPSSSETPAKASSKLSRNSVTNTKSKGIGVRAWE